MVNKSLIKVYKHFLVIFCWSLPINSKAASGLNKVFSILHPLVTANVFGILQMHPGICLTYRINYCPLILVSWVVQTHQHFWEMFIHMLLDIWNTVLYMILHNSTITFMYFDILQMFPEISVTYRIKCIPPFSYDKSINIFMHCPMQNW